ncbi:MAG: cadmium-translocating P-type ATPase [Chloroflexia bacterium]|nr:cadmium-translocating P-type ATPase [Chloroflexia bacterium]
MEQRWIFQVSGLHCADCAVQVEKGVAALEGIRQVRLNLASGRLEVEAEGALQRAVTERVRELGYQAQPVGPGKRPAHSVALWPFLRRSKSAPWAGLAGLFLLLGLLWSLLPLPPWAPRIAFAGAIVLGGIPVARSGWAALRLNRSLDINLLMTLAGLGAMLVGEWAEGAVTMFLFALGELLEGYTMERARGAIRALMDLAPDEATRLVDGGQERVPLEALQVGERIHVRPGERIPVDATVLQGHSAVDQAAITGESVPLERAPGDPVYAGTVNGEGLLILQVSRRAQDSTLARIIELVEKAQSRKAPVQRIVDRFARFYTPAVVLGAVLVATLPPLILHAPWGDWFYRALVLLVIACPCALVISTPVSFAAAIAAAAQQGVLIKGGAYLEALGRLRALALDKTGTLTEGRPAVTQLLTFDGHSEQEVLRIAAAVETGSTHPLAQAVLHEARRRGLQPGPAQEQRSLTGRGATALVGGQRFYVGNHTFFHSWGCRTEEVCRQIADLEAAGQTVILVGSESDIWGVLSLADRVRPQSRQVVAALHRAGLEHVVMLTGDNRPTAEAIARQVGVDDVRANLLPEQKVDAVEALLRRFGPVGMVGDGINDAPALARATVGVAMGVIGSDAALETADVALMQDDLGHLPWALRLGRRSSRVVAQNIALALGLKALFLGLAVAGLATLWMAVFADVGASLLVTLNGLRLLWQTRKS